MQVEKNNQVEKTLLVGIGAIKVLKFNPDLAWLQENMGWGDDSKDPEYFKEAVEVKRKDENGEETSFTANQVMVDVYYEEQKTKKKGRIHFTLTDANKVSKTEKNQYINCIGGTSYSDTEENLPKFFTHWTLKDKNDPNLSEEYPKQYRVAKIGEENFYNFLSVWTNLNPFNVNNNLFLENTKKFWQGDMKEINGLLENFGDNLVLVPFGVKTKEDGEGETKTYQVVSNRFFLAGTFLKNLRTYIKNGFQGLTKTTKYQYNLWKWYSDVMDSENGFDKQADFTVMDEIQDYTGNSPLATNQAVVEKRFDEAKK